MQQREHRAHSLFGTVIPNSIFHGNQKLLSERFNVGISFLRQDKLKLIWSRLWNFIHNLWVEFNSELYLLEGVLLPVRSRAAHPFVEEGLLVFIIELSVNLPEHLNVDLVFSFYIAVVHIRHLLFDVFHIIVLVIPHLRNDHHIMPVEEFSHVTVFSQSVLKTILHKSHLILRLSNQSLCQLSFEVCIVFVNYYIINIVTRSTIVDLTIS